MRKESEINDVKDMEFKNKFENEDNKNNNNENLEIKCVSSSNSKELIYTRRSRYLTFIVFSIISVLINLDNGFIPAASTDIKTYLDIDDAMFGLYGSLAFFGCLLGSFLSMPLLQMKNRKITFIVSIIFNIASCLGLVIKNKYWSFVMRVINGVSQSFVTIYIPLWVDQFGSRTAKSLMLAIQQISGPLGVVLGYIITVVSKKIGPWYYSVFFQCIIESIAIIFVFFVRWDFFANDIFCKNHALLKTENGNLKDKECEIELEQMNKLNCHSHSDEICKSKRDLNLDEEEKKSKTKSHGKFKNSKKNKDVKNNSEYFSNDKSHPKSVTFNTDNNLRNANGEISGIKLDIVHEPSKLNLIKQENNDDLNNVEINNEIHDKINNKLSNENIEDCENIPNSDLKLNKRQEQYDAVIQNDKYSYTKNLEDIHYKNHSKKLKELENKSILNNNECSKEIYNEQVKENENIQNNQILVKNDIDDISIFECIYIEQGLSAKEKIKEYYVNLKKLGPNKVYIFSLVTVCIFNFISFAIQYWVSDHLKEVMHFDEDSITISFIVTCVTAPVLGVILGGYIVDKLGGYTRRKAIIFCLIAALLAGSDSILIAFQETLIGFSIVLWFFLFFGGATIPNMLGILISSVPNQMKSFGTSLANTCISSLGQLPAPYVYGAIYKIDKKSRRAFNLTLLFSWVGIVFISFTAYFRYKQGDGKPKKEEKKEKVEKKNNFEEKRESKLSSHRDEKRFSQPRQIKKTHIPLEESQINPKNVSESILHENGHQVLIDNNINESNNNYYMQKNSHVKYAKIDNQKQIKGQVGKFKNNNAKENEVNLDQIEENQYNLNIDNESNQASYLDNISIKKVDTVKNRGEFENLDDKIRNEDKYSKKELKSRLSSSSFNSEAKEENTNIIALDKNENSKNEYKIPLSNHIEKKKPTFKFEEQLNDIRFLTLSKDNAQNHFEEINLTKFSTTKNINKIVK